MSLRTKLLAALVGLNGAFLLLALFLLLREEPFDARRELSGLLAEIEAARDGPTRDRARQHLDALRDAGVARDVFVVEERGRDPSEISYRVLTAEDAVSGNGHPSEVAQTTHLRVLEQFRDARRQGDNTSVAIVLPGNGQESDRVRWGLVATTVTARPQPLGIQAAYLVLVGGVLAVSAVAFWLVSRLVTRPLAALTAAADRIAAGDYRFDLPARGTGDEIDRTIAAFQRMAREIGEYQGHLEDRVLSALQRIRKAEQHLAIAQRLAATGKLASGVAHEINNPLGGMKNAVRALGRGDLPAEKTREYLDLVADGLARVEETVKKFLSFTPRSVEPRPTDLAEVARKALALARHRIERKGIRVEENLASSGEAMVFGDPNELQQVALNLLLNAADAVPEGKGGTVAVTARRDDETVVLEVRDDGAGMTPEAQAHCFDLFFTTKPVGEGTGLGLAVVHNVVTNHGGRIEVESAPGEGSLFRVLLPREGPSDGPERPISGRAAAPAP